MAEWLLSESGPTKLVTFISTVPHYFTGQTVSTVAEEKQFNPRLSKPKEQFIKIMKELQLPYPKQIGEYILFAWEKKSSYSHVHDGISDFKINCH